MIITLTTDFGTRDTFVAEMKGVILSINPMVTIIDITHEIEPFNILEGAIKLRAATKYFPLGTIHIAVVDPGVGSPRRPIIIGTERDFYIGPDNGLLSLAVRDQPIRDIYEITVPEAGPTFHGRDIFAPVAAWLSLGKSPESLGRRIEDFIRLPFTEPFFDDEKRLSGEVIMIDRFGNAITNINKDILAGRRFRVRIKGMELPVFRFYQEAGNLTGALINSSGYLEIFKYQGSAVKDLGIGLHDKVEVIIEIS